MQKTALSLVNLEDLADDFELTVDLFDELSEAGVHEVILDTLQKFGAGNRADELQVGDTVITNFLKVLQYSCQFSLQVVMQLTSAGIFEILDPWLKKDPH